MASSKLTSQDFLGKTCLVTGSNSGIGKAIALTLARRGASVVLCGRDLKRLDTALQDCVQASGGHTNRFFTVPGDVTDSNYRTELVEKTVDKFGKLDVLVCNAGTTNPCDGISAATEEIFDSYINVFLKSVFFLIQAALPELEKAKGNVINVSSIAAEHACGPIVMYAMSKAAVDHMSRCLAADLGPKGIRVNTVNPSYVKTNLLRGVSEEERAQKISHAAKKELLKQPYQDRLVKLEEIAEAVVFLASDRASFITGENLSVCGGRRLLGPSGESHTME